MLPFIVAIRLTCYAGSHKMLYSLILDHWQTRLKPLESMYCYNPKSHVSYTILSHLEIVFTSPLGYPHLQSQSAHRSDLLARIPPEVRCSRSSVLTNLTKTNRQAQPASHLLTVDLASGRAAVCRSFAHSYRGRDDCRARISGKLRGGAGQSRA